MKKILIDKGDAAAEAVGKILGEEEKDIVLVIPRNALLKESAASFELIKREASAGGKSVSVESVDEAVLEMAKSSGIDAVHPLFSGDSSFSLTDIIPKTAGRKMETKEKADAALRAAVPNSKGRFFRAKETAKSGLSKKSKKNSGEVSKPAGNAPEIFPKNEVVSIRPRPIGAKSGVSSGADDPPKFTPAKKERALRKSILFAILSVATATFSVWVITAYFSRAQITINFNKTPWIYENVFLASKTASKIAADKNINILRAEVFEFKKNMVKSFKASSVKSVFAKAGGKITVYNAYGPAAQSLVATTRFASPDGKIFRLNQKITIPGAKIKNGKIFPSKIDADVTADRPGPDYNLGPIPKLTIPGFKGSPKYNAFYGEISGSLTGGFIGERSVPAVAEVKNAKDDVAAALKTQLEEKSLRNYPADFKIFDASSQFSITRLYVNENTDKKGNFAVFGEAGVKSIGFRESDLKSFLFLLARKDNPDAVFDKLELAYSDIVPDFQNEKLNFSLRAQGVLKPEFSATDFRAKILGRNIGDVRSLTSGIRGLSSAKVSLWPFWLRSLPLVPGRVDIFVD